MTAWARKKGAEINQGVEFVKISMDDITALKPNPGSCVAIHELADVGISILACHPQLTAGQENLHKLEAARAVLAGLITTTEEVDIITVSPHPPVKDYADLEASRPVKVKQQSRARRALGP